jgi:DNA-binding beta-propeller fold protein YncE
MSRLALKAIQASAGNAGGIPWDISTAVFNGSPINNFFLDNESTTDATPHALFFKSDGLAFYTTGDQNDDVLQFDLTTAWNLSTASFTQVFSVSSEDTNPTGLFFKDDGTKMFVSGNTGNDINEYNLSTAWDISTASYSQSFSVATQAGTPEDLFFKDDGLTMYVADDGNNAIYQYTLTTAWDLSTASYASKSFSIGTQQSLIRGLHFKTDGTRMYITGSSGDDIDEYTLSTAWDVSTASFTQNISYPRGLFSEPQGLFFKPDGTVLFAMGSGADTLFSFDLSTAWDLSTLSYTLPTTNCLDVSTQATAPSDLFFKPDGTELYIIDITGDTVDQWSLSTAWNIDTASYLQSFSVNTQEISPSTVSFKDDGTKMYVCGQTGDDVNEYSLSTAWDISTASYTQNFSVSSQDLRPKGLFFKDDGTKMYMLGDVGDDINEYNLTTAWNISTASFNQNTSVSSQLSNPQGIYFRDDGLKIYISGQIFSQVYEYDLSTAWDISTLSFLQAYDLNNFVADPEGVFFKDDGKKMYVVDSRLASVFSFDL